MYMLDIVDWGIKAVYKSLLSHPLLSQKKKMSTDYVTLSKAIMDSK